MLFIGLPVIIAGFLHMAAVKLNLLPFLKIPIDAGKTYKGKRLFGENKTWRGVILMIIFSTLALYLLLYIYKVYPNLTKYNLLKTNEYPTYLFGILYGLGYSLFELPNSFIKRQQNIQGGKKGTIFNVIFDQADSVIGCFLFIYPVANYDFKFIIGGIVFFTIIHLVINVLLYLLKLRKNPL